MSQSRRHEALRDDRHKTPLRSERHEAQRDERHIKRRLRPVRTIVLDLDNTLIYSVAKRKEEKIKEIEDLKLFKHFDIPYYRVYMRPWLYEFMTFIFKHDFDIIIWTAAESDYASIITYKITSQFAYEYKKQIKMLLSKRTCEQSMKTCNSATYKDLEYLKKLLPDEIDLNETIIIDDQEAVLDVNGADKAILAPSFDALSTQSPSRDMFLLDVIHYLKERNGIR